MNVREFCIRRYVATAAMCILLGGLPAGSALAGQIEITPAKDATLYQYEHGTPGTDLNADGVGDLHVGDTNNVHGVQRGLLQFYFDPQVIPANAIVTDVSLMMTVADVPGRVLQRDINFWMVAMEGLSDQWAQGPGEDQSPARPGDTTWFHTKYDPAIHNELGDENNPLLDFSAGDPGYWPAPGYFGQDDLLDTAPGAGGGGPFDDSYALVLSGIPVIGEVVTWSNDRMVSDVQAWVDGSLDNFGWVLIGEEWITTEVILPNGRSASSKIDFFSSEAANLSARPLLTVTYHVVPEPSSILLLVTGLGMFWWRWRRDS